MSNQVKRETQLLVSSHPLLLRSPSFFSIVPFPPPSHPSRRVTPAAVMNPSWLPRTRRRERDENAPPRLWVVLRCVFGSSKLLNLGFPQFSMPDLRITSDQRRSTQPLKETMFLSVHTTNEGRRSTPYSMANQISRPG